MEPEVWLCVHLRLPSCCRRFPVLPRILHLLSFLIFKFVFSLSTLGDHIIDFDHIYLPSTNFPQTHPQSIPTQHCVSFLMAHLVQLVQTVVSWPWGLSLECGQNTRGHILKENELFLSQRLSPANSSSARGETPCPPPSSMLHLHTRGLPDHRPPDKDGRWALAQ